MWDWHWQNPVDLGRRYDFGFFEIHSGMMRTFHDNNRCQPTRGWVGSVLGRCHPDMVPARTQPVRQGRWNELAREMGGLGQTGGLQFTRGTIAACWTIESVIHNAEIILVGFDNIWNGKSLPIDDAFAPVYRANPGTFSFRGYRGGVTKSGNHDFAIERPFLEWLAKHNGVRLSFSQAVWD